MIDFTNIDQLMSGDKRIPIDTKRKFNALRKKAIAVYAPHPFDADAEGDLEQRVRNGQTAAEILAHTLEDRNARHPEE